LIIAIHNVSSCDIKAFIKYRPEGTPIHDLCDTCGGLVSSDCFERNLNTKAHYNRAEAPPPNFEFTQNIKMADDEENNKKRLVFVVIVRQ